MEASANSRGMHLQIGGCYQETTGELQQLQGPSTNRREKGGRCAPLVRERSKHNGDPLTRTEKAKGKKQKAKSKKQRAKSKTSKNEKEKTKSRAISGKEPTRPEANTTNYQLEDEGGVRFVPGDGSSWSNE